MMAPGLPPLVNGKALWALAVCCAAALHAPARAAVEEQLFLTVERNTVPLDLLWETRVVDGRVLVRGKDLKRAGIALDPSWTDEQWIDLQDISGVQYDLVRSDQLVKLTVDVARLDGPVQQLRRTTDTPDLSPGAAGLVMDYDVSSQATSDSQQIGVWGQVRTMGQAGQWSSSFRVGAGRNEVGELDDRWHDSVRLDSAFTWQDPDRMIFVTAGDTLSGSVDWSRQMRLGGVRVGRDFSLQPYRTTYPMTTLSSSAALPSTVEVFIDGVRTSQEQVLPGRFDLDVNFPVIGAGSAQVVVTDIHGMQQVVAVPLYGTSTLLEKGLTDGSAEIGYLRRDYGLVSNSYDDELMASGSWRRGLSDQFTAEAHGQWRAGSGMGGLGAAWVMPKQWGVISGSVARSFGSPTDVLLDNNPNMMADGRWQRSVSWQRSGRFLSTNVSSLRRDLGFFDVASLSEGALMATESDQAWLGLNTKAGQWNVGYIAQTLPQWFDHESQRSRYFNVGWSSRWKMVSANANIQRDLNTGNMQGYLTVAIPLEGRQRLQVSRQQGDVGRNSTSVTWSSPAPGDVPGWGWRTGLSVDDGHGAEGMWAQIDRQGRSSQWSAGWTRQGSIDNAWLQGRGGVMWLLGSAPRMVRRTDDAFAVVDTGQANVPVRLENRAVGRTDEKGRIVIDRLRPWQANKISIDTEQLPVDVVLDGPDVQLAVPRQGQGALVRFNVGQTTSIVGQLMRGSEVVDAGTPVQLRNKEGDVIGTGVVGHDGAVWLDAKTAIAFDVHTEQCTAVLPSSLPARDEVGSVNVGTLMCLDDGVVR